MRLLPPTLATCVVTSLLSLPLSGTAKNGAAAPAPRDGPPPWSVSLGEGMVRLRSPSWPMAKIVGGTFLMGSKPLEVVDALVRCQSEPMGHRCEEDLFSDETPARKVFVSSFWIDRHEVTWEQYQRCVAVGRCTPWRFMPGRRRFAAPTLPVSFVTHDDARRYCAFRGARLPTEAEWEHTARGAERRVFPWGRLYNDRLSNHGKFAWSRTDTRDGYAELAPVGSFPEGATPERVFDLAGNVAEWVSDRYLPAYLEDDVTDPQGPSAPPATAARVVRGGGYQDGAAFLRAADRRGAEPDTRLPDLGFRCARSAHVR